jgi:branched-chain amino acid transport system permease protein
MIAIAVSGLASGAIYGLMAVGVVLIYRSTKLVNFAQGEVLMFGAFAYWISQQRIDSLFSIVPIVLVGALLGIVFFVVTHYLIRSTDDLTVVVATLGISLMMINYAQLTWGGTSRRVPGWLTGDANVRIGDGAVSANSFVLIAVAILATYALHLWFRYTTMGQAVRAAAESPESASLSGLSVRKMRATSWITGCVFAAVSGLLLAPEVNVYPHMAGTILFSGFVAAGIGGFGNILGALFGGLMIGLLEGLSTIWIDAELAKLVPFAVLLAVLLVRPTGLFSERELRRV